MRLSQNRALRTADLVMNLLAAALILIAVAMYFITNPTAPGGEEGHCFRYFTTDSNLLAAIASIVWCVYSARERRGQLTEIPRWVFLLRYCSVTAVALTFTLVIVFLAPMQGLSGGLSAALALYHGNQFLLHAAAPLLCILSFCLCGGRERLPLRTVLLSMLPMVVYSVVYLILVVLLGIWPDFYGFTFGGQLALVPVSLAGVYLLTFGLAALLNVLRRRGKQGGTEG